MSKILVIVESPGKIKKIEQILGSGYIVKASYGHFRDLDKKSLSIDVSNNFKPTYITIPEKMRTVTDLKYYASNAPEVILAADEDREGDPSLKRTSAPTLRATSLQRREKYPWQASPRH